MIGTLLNGAAIVTGGLLALNNRGNLAAATQNWLKLGMGAFTVYAGLSATWRSVNGSALSCLKQLGIVVLAMMLGKPLGRLLRIQASLNKLGAHAQERFSRSHQHGRPPASDGFLTCTLLFCAPPIALLGAIEEGLTGSFRTLGVKSLMDGLAAVAFFKSFGPGIMLSALPVVAFQGTVTLVCHGLQPWLAAHGLADSIGATGGMLVFCVALLLLEIKRIEIGDYYPSLALAPLLTWLFGR